MFVRKLGLAVGGMLAMVSFASATPAGLPDAQQVDRPVLTLAAVPEQTLNSAVLDVLAPEFPMLMPSDRSNRPGLLFFGILTFVGLTIHVVRSHHYVHRAAQAYAQWYWNEFGPLNWN